MTTAFSTSASSLPPKTTPPAPDKKAFPEWWPTLSDQQPLQKYIAFADHIAHVIVPNITDDGGGGGIVDSIEGNGTMTCEEVVRWVLRAERDRHSSDLQSSNGSLSRVGAESDPDHDNRQLRIETEWAEGQTIATPLKKVLDAAYRHDPSDFPQEKHPIQPNLIAVELLALGSVWHLPHSTSKSNVDRFDPSNGMKPTRLNVGDRNKTAHIGDYFRVHFDPRRFLDTNLYDWGTADGAFNDTSDKPGVVVARDDEAGYIIINKPPNIPVHARVDNSLENVAASIGRTAWMERRESITSDEELDPCDDMVENNVMYDNPPRIKRKRKNRKQKKEPLIYVATPQRLDQNTSGLLVVATKKSFAAYFAKLLRTKTTGQLHRGGLSRSSSCGVHKTYRCLVCITPQNEPGDSAVASVASEIDRLKQYSIMKHFLEPSIRAPKRFVATVPDDVDNSKWAECLLKITKISEVCTVVGNAPSDTLAKALWGDFGKPSDCVAVAECEIELLTGRTHQIRGQLAAEGFPLVGDVQYGGAVPNTSSVWKERCKGRAESYLDSELLALQCCSLEFLDPQYAEKSDESVLAKRSKLWNSFRLDSASWTPSVSKYFAETAELSSIEATSLLNEEAPLLKRASKDLERHSDAPTAHNASKSIIVSWE